MTDTTQPPNPHLIQLDGLTIDLDDYCIHYADGTTVLLGGQEQLLLRTLIDAGGRLVTMETLGREVWGWERGYPVSAIWSCVSDLRRKLGDDPFHPRYIQTLRGMGYRFRRYLTREVAGQPPTAAKAAAPRPKERADGRRKR